MHNLETRLSNTLIQHRWWFGLLAIVSVLLAASGATKLVFTSDYRIFFSEDNPQLVAFEESERTYTKDDNVLIVLAPGNGDVFTQHNLAILENLTERAWQVPYSTRVDSLTNFQHTHADQDDLIVQDLVRNPAQLDQAQLEQIRGIALSEPRLVGRLISEAGHVTAVNITLQLPEDPVAAFPEVVSFVRQLVSETKAMDPDTDIYLSGLVMFNNAFNEAAMQDASTLLPLSFALMLVMLAILLGSFTATLATLVVITSSIAGALGLCGHLGIPLTNINTNGPLIILTVAVANSVHIVVNFLNAARHGESNREALRNSLRINLHPVFLASATTAIGFLTLLFSEVPPFGDLGIMTAMGVIISMILAFTLLPMLLLLFPVTYKPRAGTSFALMDRLGKFVVTKRRVLFYGMTALVLLSLAGLPRNELNDVYADWFDPAVEFRADTDFITDNLTGLYQIAYSLKAGEPGGVSEPLFLENVAAFADWYRAQPETMHVSVISDTMQRLNRNMHGDDPEMYRLPDNRDLAAQYLLLYELSLPYGLDLNNELDIDKSATRMIVTLETLSTNDLLALSKRADTWLASNSPNISSAIATGPVMMFSHIGARNIPAMLLAGGTALVLISIILIGALRSIKIGLISLVPNLAPAAMGFGLWGFFQAEVGLGLSVVASMTLGIVVDDSVHFLSKYLRARREQGLDPAAAVQSAFHTVGTALLFTSLVLAVGFFILATSLFKLSADMGLLTGIVILLALVLDFLLLPPLLMKLEESRNAKMANADPAADTATG